MRIFKKILLAAAVFFFTSLPVQAQTSNFGERLFQVLPGINCGVPNSNVNICCAYPKDPVQINLKTGYAVVDAPLNVISGVFETVSNTVVNLTTAGFQKVAPVPACINGAISSSVDPYASGCVCTTPDKPVFSSLIPLCNLITGPEQAQCLSCINKGAVWTSIGCVYGDLGSFIQNNVFSWAIGVAGGLALLCIIFAAFQMQSSQGNPEKVKKAQEMLTSCIMGLMLIIFSVFILQLIGVKILQIPGFK